MPAVVDDGSDEQGDLMDALDAELAQLDLQDREMVAQLRAAVLSEVDRVNAVGGGDRIPPVEAAARVCAAILRAVADMGRDAGHGPDPVNGDRCAELADLQRELADAHHDPRFIGHQSFGDLWRAFRDGRTSR